MMISRMRKLAPPPSAWHLLPYSTFGSSTSSHLSERLLSVRCFSSSGGSIDANFYENQVKVFNITKEKAKSKMVKRRPPKRRYRSSLEDYDYDSDNDSDKSLVRPMPRSAMRFRDGGGRDDATSRETRGGNAKRFDNSRRIDDNRHYTGSKERVTRRDGSSFMRRKDAAKRKADKKRVVSVDTDLPTQFVSSEPKRMFRQDWIQMKDDMKQTKGKEETSGKGNGGESPSEKRQPPFFGDGNNQTEKRRALTPAMKNRDWADPSANFPPNDMKIFVSCLPGLEPFLYDEMRALGFDCAIEAGGVTPTSTVDLEDILKCHLHLGTASHVLVRCGNPFWAVRLKEVKQKVALYPWHQFLSGHGLLQVRVTAKKSKLNHNTAIRAAVIDGINESLKKNEPQKKRTVSHAKEGSENALHMLVRVEHDEFVLSIDTSQTPMHRRGYRLETAKAPLREDLAFAMVYSAGWCVDKGDPKRSKASKPAYAGFLDPFCGSGTIAIEAARAAAGLPPGNLRPPPLQGTVLYNPKEWGQQLVRVQRKESKSNKDGRKRFQIAASDRDEGAVAAAIANARRAGVEDMIDIQHSAISSHPWLTVKKASSGGEEVDDNDDDESPYPLLVCTNPPYGLRITADKKKSKEHPLLPLYQTLVHRQNTLSASGSLISTMTLLQNPNLFRRTGAKFEVKFSSQHGGIPVAAVFTPAPSSK